MIKKLSDAYKLWREYLISLDRASRFTIGLTIEKLFIEILELVLLAGYSPRDHKAAVLQRANAKLDVLKFFIRLIWETKILDHKKYAALSVPLVEAGRMLGGWRKQLTNEAPPMDVGGAV